MRNSSALFAIEEAIPGFRRFNRRRRLTWILALLSLFRLTCSRQLSYTYTYEDAGLYVTIELQSCDHTESKNLYNYRMYLSDSILSYKQNNYIDFCIPPYYGSFISLDFEPGKPHTLYVQTWYRDHIVRVNCPDYDVKIRGDLYYFPDEKWNKPARRYIRYNLNDDMDRIKVYGEDGVCIGETSIVDVSMVKPPVLIVDRKPKYIGICYDGYRIVRRDSSQIKK